MSNIVKSKEEWMELQKRDFSLQVPHPMRIESIKSLNNAEIEFVAELCLKKFGFEAIESLYNSFKDQKLLGLIKRKWTVNSMEDDIQKIFGVFEEKGDIKVGIPEKEQFNRYIHLVYAENIPGVMVLESPPDEYLTKIAAEAYLKLKIEDLEALMDYQLSNEDFRFSRYGKKITFEDLQKDVNEAINFKLK